MSCRIIKSSGIRYENEDLYVDFPDTILNDYDIVIATIVQDIYHTSPFGRVFFTINDTDIEIYTKYHNHIRITQLKKGFPYTMGYGEEAPSLVVLNCLPKVPIYQEAQPIKTVEE